MKPTLPLARQQSYARARKARDARFDGVFFIAVKTTGIYCRPICPAKTPLEKNVSYFESAILAAQAGFRPCLRCRPESAPESYAWLGCETTFQRALTLIQQGELQACSMDAFCERLGVSDRYLRKLFQQHLGTSPKQYALYQQCLFAKQLLHESALGIADIAFASGFKSVRRFNEAIKKQLGLTPSAIRSKANQSDKVLKLKLYYRPQFAWLKMHQFLAVRSLNGLEWVDEGGYSRTIEYLAQDGANVRGYFSIKDNAQQHYLDLSLTLNDYRYVYPIVQKIKAMFDLQTAISEIDQQLKPQLAVWGFDYQEGLRLPGIWSVYEAGIRAILGQQISVAGAHKLLDTLLENLSEVVELPCVGQKYYFPTPKAVAKSELDFFAMPQSRKDCLRAFSQYCLTTKNVSDVDQWLAIKGIGPWTINYVKMRALKDPDIWLAGDAGLKNALKLAEGSTETELVIEQCKPWRSYLTFQLWNLLQ